MQYSNLNSIPVRNPINAANPERSAIVTSLPPMSSPNIAPRNGPRIKPHGAKNIIPINVPSILPQKPHREPLPSLVPITDMKLSSIVMPAARIPSTTSPLVVYSKSPVK